MYARASSVREGVQHDLDPERIAIGGELLEVSLVLGFSLERIGDVGVVSHEHMNVPAAFVSTRSRTSGLSSRRSSVRPAASQKSMWEIWGILKTC